MMAPLVDAKALRNLRKAKGLTQDELAKRSRINKQTISRLERGVQQARRAYVVQWLCDTLETDKDTLSGRKPVGEEQQPDNKYLEMDNTQLNVRIDRGTRNALTLVARRYRVPATRIIELAPLGFHIMAEASLRRRRQRLGELERQLDALDEAAKMFGHLPVAVGTNYLHDDIVTEERKSIENRDIVGDQISADLWDESSPVSGYDFETHNAFAAYLKDAIAELDEPAEWSGWSRNRHLHYEICRDDVVRLLGDDNGVVDGVLNGSVLLSEMPRELLANGPAPERAAWVRGKLAEWRRKKDEEWEKLGIDVDLASVSEAANSAGGTTP